MADSFFAAFAARGQKHPKTDGRLRATKGQQISADSWLNDHAPDWLSGNRGQWWFDDPSLVAAASEFQALATHDGLQKHGMNMNSVTSQADTQADAPLMQSPMRHATNKVMHFLAVGAPPVFIALLTPWVWLDWSFSLYLETAGSVIAGLGAATFVTTGFLSRKRRLALAEQRYGNLSPEQQARVVTVDQALERLERRGRQYGDAEISAHIQQITQSIRSVLPVLIAENGSDAELFYTIRQTAFDYLPSTLDAYQRIPAEAVQSQDEQAPRQLLLEQLQLIESNIKQLASQITENGRQALQANGRFLQERFRAPGSATGASLPPADE